VVTVPILRTSERTTFKRCPAKWWWSYREGLKPKGPEKTPLWFGTGVHLAFALWYLPGLKRGVPPVETWEEYARDALHFVKTNKITADEEKIQAMEDGAELGRILMEEYIKEYGDDPDWDFIQAEQTFSMPIPWPKEKEARQMVFDVGDDGEILVYYKGTIDGVYRRISTGRIEVLETKTAASVVLTHLPLDDQAGSYWAVAGHSLREQKLIRPNEFIAGINYNFVRKGTPDERPRDAEGYYCNKPVKADYAAALGLHQTSKLPKLEDLEAMASQKGIVVLGERSKSQPKPLFQREFVVRTKAEQKSQLRRIQDEAVVMEAYRQKLLPITKTPDRSCATMCEHYQMCELQERGGNWQDFKSAAYRVQDPYADHRKTAAE
jgi:hypothetical protein